MYILTKFDSKADSTEWESQIKYEDKRNSYLYYSPVGGDSQLWWPITKSDRAWKVANSELPKFGHHGLWRFASFKICILYPYFL